MKIKQIKDPAMIIASHDFHLQFQWNFFLMKTHKCLIIYWFQSVPKWFSLFQIESPKTILQWFNFIWEYIK